MWIIAGLVLLGLAAAALALKPLYRAGKNWRSRQLSVQAEGFISAGKWEEAAGQARAAYQLSPEEPAALRAVAHLQGATGHPSEALPFWGKLEQGGALTPADRQEYATDLFYAGQLDQAESQNKALLAGGPRNAALLRLAARIAAARGAYAQSLDDARQACAADPANAEGKLLLALLEMRGTDKAAQMAGLETAMEVGRDRGRIGLEALTYLARMRGLPPQDAAAIVPLLKAHPLASEEQRLMALDVQINARPEDRAALLDAAFAEYKQADLLRRRKFGVWLNEHGEYERTLKLIPIGTGLKRKDLLLVDLDALAALKQWSKIQELLQGKNVPLDGVYLELFQARSATELGQPTVASLHWTRAHQAAGPSLDQMWYLGQYAEKIGQLDQAELAYQSLKSNATSARKAYEALLLLAQKRGDEEETLKLLGEMHQRFPQDDAVANDYLYFTLLKGAGAADCLQPARALVERAPASLAHRTTLALACYRLQDGPSALAVYDGLQIPWDQVPAGDRAVYAAVLGLAGKQSEAQAQAKAIRVEALRPEERELVKPWLPQ